MCKIVGLNLAFFILLVKVSPSNLSPPPPHKFYPPSSSKLPSSAPLNVQLLETGLPVHGPFATRLFLTDEPNKLNLVWSCNLGEEKPTRYNLNTNAEVWYVQLKQRSITQKLTPSFADHGWKVCSYNTTVSLKKNSTLHYRVACDGSLSQTFTIRYKYWDISSDKEDTWVLMSVGSLGFYNTTQLSIRVLEEVSRNNENVLWTIPGGLLIDSTAADNVSLSKSESGLRWILWLRMVENVTCCAPMVASPSREDVYADSSLDFSRTGNFGRYLYLPYHEEQPWYSFDHRNLHVVSVCTFCNLSSGAPQLKWIEDDLRKAQTTNTTLWTMVMGHEPNDETDQSIKSAGKVQLEQLLDKFSVDFAVWSHERWYERTMPIRDFQVTDTRLNNYLDSPNGTIHYTCGTGGMPLQTFNMHKFNHSAHYRDNTFGVCTFTKSTDNHFNSMFTYLDSQYDWDLTQYDFLTIVKSVPASADAIHPMSVFLITGVVIAVLVASILFCFVAPRVLHKLYPSVVVNKIRSLNYGVEDDEEEIYPRTEMEDPTSCSDKVMLITSDEEDVDLSPPKFSMMMT